MSRQLTRKSEAQGNAEALARRSASYADEHARSWQVRFGTPTHELSTRALLVRLGEARRAETPMKLHEGPDHVDGGGTPAMTPAFLGYLDSGATGILERQPKTDTQGRPLDPVIVGTYRKPLAAAIESMERCSGRIAWWSRIVHRIIEYGEEPASAAIAEGSHQYEAKRTANEALAECYRRITPDKMALPKRGAEA